MNKITFALMIVAILIGLSACNKNAGKNLSKGDIEPAITAAQNSEVAEIKIELLAEFESIKKNISSLSSNEICRINDMNPKDRKGYLESLIGKKIDTFEITKNSNGTIEMSLGISKTSSDGTIVTIQNSVMAI